MADENGGRDARPPDEDEFAARLAVADKTAADALARQLATDEGLRAARRQQQGLPQTTGGAGQAEPAGGPRPISIWQPQEIAGGKLQFVRPEPLPLGDHYAAQRVLGPKAAGVTRVCYFGESAAAGYLYAPHLTPAAVLADKLNSAGEQAFEVVDLSRVNETLPGLVATVRASLQLAPDLLVIFSGNNWNLLHGHDFSPGAPTVEGRQRFGDILAAGGVIGCVDHGARRRLEQIGAALAAIAAAAGAAGVPVILVIPEVNLADWETRQPVTWLPGDGSRQWYRLLAEAAAQLDQGNDDAALARARQMIRLDDATCPTPWRIMAQVMARRGDDGRRAAAGRSEIDSTHYANLGFLSAPQASSLDQEVQRRAAPAHGFAVVDLPAVFADYSGRQTPGRDLFLDYCHLNLTGIDVAMAALASEILRLSGGAGATNWRDLLSAAPQTLLPPAAAATAQFGAAIHTGHRLLPVSRAPDIIAYWCREALQTAPGIESTLIDYVAIRAAVGPATLSAAQRRNFHSPFRLLYAHGLEYDYLDFPVIGAIRAALQAVGSTAAGAIDALLLARHGLSATPIDLVFPPFYQWQPLARYYLDLLPAPDQPDRLIFRAFWPLSTFGFVAAAERDVQLALTLRRAPVGPAAPAGSASLSINGTVIKTFQCQTDWHTLNVRVPSRHLQRGVNQLSIHWPELPPAGDTALQTAADRLALGLTATIHPIFGEIYTLRAAES